MALRFLNNLPKEKLSEKLRNYFQPFPSFRKCVPFPNFSVDSLQLRMV